MNMPIPPKPSKLLSLNPVDWGHEVTAHGADSRTSSFLRRQSRLLPSIQRLKQRTTFLCSVFFHSASKHNEKANDKPKNLPYALIATPNPACGFVIRSPYMQRLGNQMFIYASFYGMSRKIDRKVSLIEVTELPSSLDKIFEKLSIRQEILNASWITSLNSNRLQERWCCDYDDFGFDKLNECDGKNFCIDGYRNSFKYFQGYFTEIKKEFSFKSSIRAKAEAILVGKLADLNLTRESCVLVGVHARRGDFLEPHISEYGHIPASAEYIKRAVKFYEDRFLNGTLRKTSALHLVFVVIGNDHDWNQSIIRSIAFVDPRRTRVVLLDHRKTDAAGDMHTMSVCDHVIISTGTFGWWSAFFSSGMVTYQKEFAVNNSRHIEEYDSKDYFLEHWIPL